MKTGSYACGGVDALINTTIQAEHVHITAAQFNQYKKQVDFLVNMLGQQIVSMDVALSLMMERVVPEEEREGFKAEIGRRVKAIADDLVKKQKEAERKITLV